MCSVEPVDCRLATGGVLAPLGPVFAPAEPSPRVVTPSVALARAHLGYDMAVRGMEAARVMADGNHHQLAGPRTSVHRDVPRLTNQKLI